MKYKPSRPFLLSVGLLILSFFVMQGVVVPSIVREELGAQALSSKATQSKASTISGTLVEQHYDELNTNTNRYETKHQKFYLKNDAGVLTPISVTNESIAESLVNEKVTYKASDKSLAISASTDLRVTDAGRENISRDVTPRPGVGTREGKAAVFLVNFESNDRQIPVPLQNPRDIEDYLFDERKGQFQKFFNEMSHGQVTYTGDVFGWYDMPGYGADPAYQGFGPCTVRDPYLQDPQPFESRLQDMISAYGVNITDYNTVVIMSRCGDYGTIGGYADNLDFGGQNYYFTEIKGHPTRFDFTGSSDYTNYPHYVGILNHEIGHTFGLSHSNSLDCDEKTIWHDCVTSWYGNAFDAMGYPDGARIFNFSQQYKAGWLDSGQILKINSPGIYHIDNLQTQNGIIAAYIFFENMNDSPVFALEHRKAEGFDWLDPWLFGGISNGLLIYSNIDGNGSNYLNPISQWRIIDPNPTVAGIYQDLQYDAITGNFHDDVTGIGVEIISVTPDGINFSVDYDPAPPLSPGCTDFIATNYDPDADVDDGSCLYPGDPIPGCMDSSALNFNPSATVSDGSCTYDVITIDCTSAYYPPEDYLSVSVFVNGQEIFLTGNSFFADVLNLGDNVSISFDFQNPNDIDCWDIQFRIDPWYSTFPPSWLAYPYVLESFLLSPGQTMQKNYDFIIDSVPSIPAPMTKFEVEYDNTTKQYLLHIY